MLYVYEGAVPAVTYYALRGMAEFGDLVIGDIEEKPEKYLEELNTLPSAGTAWLIFSHVDTNDGINEERFMLRHLDSTGTRLVERQTKGASLYQYRLAPARR